MAKGSFAKFRAEHICHLKTVRHRNIPHFCKLFCQSFYPSLTEIFHCFLSNRQNHVVLTFCRSLQTLEKICIVSACQSSVTRDHYIAGFIVGGLFRINRCEICILSCNLFQCLMKFCKVRTAYLCAFLCLTQFGGCYKLHGLGNLHSTLYTLDTQLYRFHIRSHTIPS